MPKVTFVNERRTLDVAAGHSIADIADQAGIAIRREQFVGTGVGDCTVWVKGPSGSVTPPGFLERLWGAHGWKRFANRAVVLGDVEVFTQGGLASRLSVERPVDHAPTPTTDPAATRLGPSAAGTAAFPTGHPLAVGKGAREAVARSTAKPKAKGAAEPAADE
jgi:hypothetical protein